MITRTFKLCLNAGTGSAPYINVNQYDKGETWLFELYTEQGERYLPTTGAIVGIKSDGHGIANTGTVDSNGRVVINETQQMTASAGRAIFELSIDGLTHGTANFIVAVERKPTDEAVMSDSDLSLIQEAIDSAEVIVEVIGDGDPSEVIGEHVDDWLDAHPEATTTVEDGAITAPKINQSLWDKLLVSEEASGNPASFDDGADDVPVSSLKVALEPVQLGSGDPSPSNIRPIVASNGKNLANFVDNKNVGISGAVENYAGRIATVDAIPIDAQKSYTVLFDNTDTKLCIYAVWNGSTLVRRVTSVATNTVLNTSDGTSLYVCIYSGNTPVTVESAHAMVVDSAITDFTYQPYQGIAVERTGKNLWKFNNSYTLSAAGSWLTVDASRSFPLKAGTYTWSFNALQAIDTIQMYFRTANDVSKTVSFYVGTGTGRKSYTFTLDEDVAVLRSAYCNGAMSIENIQIERGSEATEYEPFIGTSYPYTLGQSVYGGSVDLTTGVLTVTHGIVDLGSLTWEANSGGFYATVPYSIANDKKSYCSAYEFVPSANWTTAAHMSAELSDGQYAWYSNIKRAFFKNTAYATADEFKTAVTGQQLVYTLETPTTVQLTPTEVKTLLGYNNISSTGTVDVIYHADTKLYVDKMTNVDNAIIAPTEVDFVATRNYTTGDLVIVNDTLYKCTANIASGSAITPNSNVTATTLGALIKALS